MSFTERLICLYLILTSAALVAGSAVAAIMEAWGASAALAGMAYLQTTLLVNRLKRAAAAEDEVDEDAAASQQRAA